MEKLTTAFSQLFDKLKELKRDEERLGNDTNSIEFALYLTDCLITVTRGKRLFKPTTTTSTSSII